MSTLVKVEPNGQMVIPGSIRSAVGLADGDLVEVEAAGGKIIVTPKPGIDRSNLPTADDEYTPAQRRAINARLDEAEKGPYYGPFKSGSEVVAFLKKKVRNRAKSGKLKKSR